VHFAILNEPNHLAKHQILPRALFSVICPLAVGTHILLLPVSFFCGAGLFSVKQK
jgi:hypothetical protein